MNHLVIGFIALYAAANCEASLFTWGRSAETKEPKLPGYSPILHVRKYNSIQIDPIRGPPVYLPSVPDSNNLEAQTTQLSPEQIYQLDLINRLSTFLPEEGGLQEMDLNAVLPYADLISEDSLENFKNNIEAAQPKEKSKLLKIIEYLKYLKEKKLKPFKYVASLGSSLVHKKKNLLGWGTTSTTTLEPYTETPPVTYPTYDTYNLAPQPSFPAFPPVSYYPPQFLIKAQNLPSADQFPPSFPSPTLQKQPNETPAGLPSPSKSPLPALPQFPPFPPAFQFPSNFLPNQFQPPASVPPQNSPSQAQYQYQFPALPVQPVDPAKNKVAYKYKEPPASTYAFQDTNAIRQFASSNESKLPSKPATKPGQSNEPQYPYQSNQIPSFNPPQLALPSPKYQPTARYPASYLNSNQEPNKFYTSSANDLVAAGSENVEKTEERAKSDSSNNLKNDLESAKVNNAVSSTETSISKSQPVVSKRTLLRAVPAPTTAYPVYPSLPREEDLKDDGNKSSSAVTVPTTN